MKHVSALDNKGNVTVNCATVQKQKRFLLRYGNEFYSQIHKNLSTFYKSKIPHVIQVSLLYPDGKWATFKIKYYKNRGSTL